MGVGALMKFGKAVIDGASRYEGKMGHPITQAAEGAALKMLSSPAGTTSAVFKNSRQGADEAMAKYVSNGNGTVTKDGAVLGDTDLMRDLLDYVVRQGGKIFDIAD